MNTILLLLGLVMAQEAVHVETVDGDSFRGGLVSWSDDMITLDVDDQRKQIESDHLVRVVGRPPEPGDSRARIAVELLDGSRLTATSIDADANRAMLDTPFGQVTCPMRTVHTIRWLSAKVDDDAAWNELTDNEFDGDAVVLRREANQLDFMEGTIRAISQKAVTFELDDQSVDLPLARLAGIVLFRPAGEIPAAGRFRLATHDGSSLQGNRITFVDGQLQIQTASDIPLTVPLANLAEVVFSTDNLVYVSDLEPESVDVDPYLAPSIGRDWVMATLYRPRINEGFADRPLQLQFSEEIAPRSYAKGLALHSRSRLIYRLDQPFRNLRGVIGWDPDVGAAGGAVQVMVLAGKQTLFDKTWNPGDAPVEIDLPIADARRLELFVDYGDDSDAGDRINFCNLRLLK